MTRIKKKKQVFLWAGGGERVAVLEALALGDGVCMSRQHPGARLGSRSLFLRIEVMMSWFDWPQYSVKGLTYNVGGLFVRFFFFGI